METPLGAHPRFCRGTTVFQNLFAKHNLSSFKFSTKVWERNMIVNTPILDGYENKNKVVKREAILERLWNTDDDYFASRSLDVFVSRLRKLLASDNTVQLKTIKGVGLMLESPAPGG